MRHQLSVALVVFLHEQNTKPLKKNEHSGAAPPIVVKTRGVNVPRSTLMMRSDIPASSGVPAAPTGSVWLDADTSDS